MAWAKLHTELEDHGKTLNAGDEAFGVYVRSILYCARQMTDGFITAAWVAKSVGRRGDLLTAKLVEVGFWEPVDGGFQIHDYLDHQPSKAAVSEQKRKVADRQAKARSARNGHGGVT